MNRQKIIKKVSFSQFFDITARIRAIMVDVLQQAMQVGIDYAVYAY